MIKRIFLIIVALMFTGCNAFSNTPKDAVAEIDGRVILQSEYDAEFKNYENMYKNNAEEEFSNLTTSQSESQNSILKKGVLEKLIIRATVEKEFNDLNLTLSDEQIQKRKEEVVESLGGSDQYKKFIEKNGIDEEFFDASIKENLMTEALKDNFKNDFKPTDDELKSFYDENKEKLYRYDISIILTEKEEDAYKIIRSHESFDKLAIEHSKDPVSAVQGGKLKGINPEELPRELEEKIKTAELNEFLDPIKIADGYYVLRVDAAYKDYADLKPLVIDAYLQKEFKNYLEELRDKNNVKVYMELQ